MFGGKKPTAKHVRDMVAAHGKVPPQLRDQYKKKVIGHARAAGAMQHIPPSWVGGKDKADAKSGGAKGGAFGGKKAPPFGQK